MQTRQVFWTGGIGDILTLEATWTDEYRKSIVRMYWASRSYPQMAAIFTRCPSYPNLIDHISLWDHYPDGMCFIDFESAYETSLHRHLVTGPIEDWSISKRFHDLSPYKGSGLLKHKLSSVKKFNLPEEYVLVCPYSSVNKKSVQEWRRFKDSDWEWLLNYLAEKQRVGVVVNTGDDFIPSSSRLINLSNQTTLGEALEIAKNASFYVGIDMAFSIVAAHMLPPDRIIIATQNAILWAYKHIYYAPHTTYDFIVPHLGATDRERDDWIRNSERMNPNLFQF
jgi:hypothetical protein